MTGHTPWREVKQRRADRDALVEWRRQRGPDWQHDVGYQLQDVLRAHRYDYDRKGSKPDDPGWHACTCGWEGYWSSFHPHVADHLRAAVAATTPRRERERIWQQGYQEGVADTKAERDTLATQIRREVLRGLADNIGANAPHIADMLNAAAEGDVAEGEYLSRHDAAAHREVAEKIAAAIGMKIRTPPGVQPSDVTLAYMDAQDIARDAAQG